MLFKERKRKKEAMARGYNIHKRSAQKEALERWENEGGRVDQHRDYVLDSIGEEYRRRKDQIMHIRRLGNRNEILPMEFFITSDKTKSITGQSVGVGVERTLPQSMFTV